MILAESRFTLLPSHFQYGRRSQPFGAPHRTTGSTFFILFSRNVMFLDDDSELQTHVLWHPVRTIKQLHHHKQWLVLREVGIEHGSNTHRQVPLSVFSYVWRHGDGDYRAKRKRSSNYISETCTKNVNTPSSTCLRLNNALEKKKLKINTFERRLSDLSKYGSSSHDEQSNHWK